MEEKSLVKRKNQGFRTFAHIFLSQMLKRLLLLALISAPSFFLPAQQIESLPAPAGEVKAVPEINRTDLITIAKDYLGTPYRRGSSNPKKGFDCSGFVSFVFKKFDIPLPRSSREYKSLGTALKPEDFKVGDILVFYGFKDKSHIGHVGIICEANGLNSKFIHASSGRVYQVTISDLGSQGYKRRFYKCIDVISK